MERGPKWTRVDRVVRAIADRRQRAIGNCYFFGAGAAAVAAAGCLAEAAAAAAAAGDPAGLVEPVATGASVASVLPADTAAAAAAVPEVRGAGPDSTSRRLM